MKDIKIPSSVNIGGQVIPVVIVNEEDKDSPLNNRGSDYCGFCGLWDMRAGTIYLNDTLSPSMMYNTLVHEVLHAALDTLGYYKVSTNEIMVNSLAAVLTEALTTAKYDECEEKIENESEIKSEIINE